jgi:hypothetical protein
MYLGKTIVNYGILFAKISFFWSIVENVITPKLFFAFSSVSVDQKMLNFEGKGRGYG